MSKKEDLIAAQKKLSEQLKKQKETGETKNKKKKQKETIDYSKPLKTAPKESSEFRMGGKVDISNFKGQF
jgi:hypothetical protein